MALSRIPRDWVDTVRNRSRSNMRSPLSHARSSSTSSNHNMNKQYEAAGMKILFICTAHNSLSQRLYLALAQSHSVTVEYALSREAMIEAAELATPDLIICPFLTSHIPKEIYSKYLTLIVHPGPPGDAGPSALDWVLMGDDGTEQDADALLERPTLSEHGRSHWGVTVLQAVEEFDAGPVWAFEQFPVDIDAPDATKSNLYRGPVTRAALAATLAAIDRIDAAAAVQPKSATDDFHPTTSESATDPADASTSHRGRTSTTDRCGVSQQTSPDPGATTAAGGISPRLTPDPSYRTTSVTLQAPFLGGATHHRPLLKAAQRDFDVHTHTAREISRRIRCADSQPGCLTRLFGGVNLYVYGGTVEEGHDVLQRQGQQAEPGSIIACRGEAVCVATCDGKGIWVNHVRRLKRRCDAMLWPKVPAVSGLRELGLLSDEMFEATRVPRATHDWSRAAHSTSQDVWVEFAEHPQRAAYVYFEFYNGAMSTDQCSELLEALAFVASTHSDARPLGAVVLMGGASYFSNGIALNVIEAAADPSLESWRNINRIDDVVQVLLEDFPQRGIATVAAIRGNCAAGGVALAAACDVVIAGSEAVLNPAYRALGLYGSEFHSLSYPGRCGAEGARHLLRDMLPLSAYGARAMGLVDHALPGHGAVLERRVRNHVRAMLASPYTPGRWKAAVREQPLAVARAQELGEMAKDFWSPRSERYHSRRREFVRKVRATQTPLRFASHRRGRGGRLLDEEEADAFDDASAFERRALERVRAEVERQAAVPLSPTDSGIQMDDAMSPVMGGLGLTRKDRKDMGPVFTCYYEGATA